MNTVAETLEKAYLYKIFSLIFYPSKLKEGIEKIKAAVEHMYDIDPRRIRLTLDVASRLCSEEAGRELNEIIGEMKKHEPLERKLVPGVSIGAILADIAGFYRAFNLKTSGETPMDHLSVELEFMANLALKEAYAILNRNEEMLEIVTKAGRDFLRDHLSRTAAYVAVLKKARNRDILEAAGLFEDFINMELGRVDAPKLPSSVEEYGDGEDAVKCPFA